MIEGWTVQFIPVADDLDAEALARPKKSISRSTHIRDPR